MRDQSIQIHRLKKEIERLAAQNEILLRELRGEGVMPPELGLSRQESFFMFCVMARPVVSKDQLMEALYPHAEKRPQKKIIDVMLCDIRKKITPHGYAITTQARIGYSMPDDMRERLRKHVAGVA